jgi:hypothetical protein
LLFLIWGPLSSTGFGSSMREIVLDTETTGRAPTITTLSRALAE